jgi:hypothetical protein
MAGGRPGRADLFGGFVVGRMARGAGLFNGDPPRPWKCGRGPLAAMARRESRSDLARPAQGVLGGPGDYRSR